VHFSKEQEGATLKLLKLDEVGPAKHLAWELAPRLNLITGDNGLGKTFLLECAWWALTGTWPGYPARPHQAANLSSISFQVGKDDDKVQTAIYKWDRLTWDRPAERNIVAGLSIFSQADSSFVVWDPAKYAASQAERAVGNGLIRFSRSDVLNGIREVDQFGRISRVVCDGLIYDWVRWQESADQTRFKEFSAALYALSPHPTSEPLVPGRPARMPELGDARDIPTLKFPYGEDVPILLCSAGIQRIVTLAYLLTWVWQDHVKTAESIRREPEKSIVLLIDEMEAHLHPLWQRLIVPALLQVVKMLAPEVQIQMIVATHSPLILASVEPLFDEAIDSLFNLSLENDTVQLEEIPFVKRGRVDQWLMSDIFGLAQPRSIEAEEAIAIANELQLEGNPAPEKVAEISERLVNVLAPNDEYWPRWTYFAEQRGVRL